MLNKEREFLQSLVPEVSKALAQENIITLEKNAEQPESLLRGSALPGMFVDKQYGGMGLSGKQAIQVHMAVASHSPSLALMMTMHNFTILTLKNMTSSLPYAKVLLEAVARDHCLVASGFAEGRSGADILDANVMATKVSGGYELSGTKKPCTMAYQFDFLTAGVSCLNDDGIKLPGLAIILKDSEGIYRKDFWSSPVLSAAGSHEVQLDRVLVDDEKILVLDKDDIALQLEMLRIHQLGLSWFQLIVSASYLGVAGALADMLRKKSKKDHHAVFDVLVSFQASVAMLERVAQLLDEETDAGDLLEQSLSVRFCVQQHINKIVDICVDQLGGLNYIENESVQYLMAVTRCFAFHPLSKSASMDLLTQFFEKR